MRNPIRNNIGNYSGFYIRSLNRVVKDSLVAGRFESLYRVSFGFEGLRGRILSFLKPPGGEPRATTQDLTSLFSR